MTQPHLSKLDPATRAALKDDIRNRGVLSPIIKDHQGNVLDGLERLPIIEELRKEGVRIRRVPTVVIRTTNGEVDRLAINTLRRHLTPAQFREHIRWIIAQTPYKSDRKLADELGTSPQTVGRARKTVPNGAVPVRTGKDGVNRHLPLALAATETAAKEAQKLLTALGDDARPGPNTARDLRKQAGDKTRKAIIDAIPVSASVEAYQVRHGDFASTAKWIGANKAHVVIVDPPWRNIDKFAIGDFAKACFSVLKPGGMCALQLGVTHVSRHLKAFEKAGFTYEWEVVILRESAAWGTAVRAACGRPIRSGFCPVVLFQKPGKLTTPPIAVLQDVIVSKGPDKTYHKWQSNYTDYIPLVRALCPPEGLVVDLTVCTGSVALAVIETGRGRTFKGGDIDAKMIRVARSRIATAVGAAKKTAATQAPG